MASSLDNLTAAATPARRDARAPSPLVARALLILAGAGLAGVLYLFGLTESTAALRSPGGLFTGLGRFFAFTGTYTMAIMVLLAARLPGLERAVGHDRLVRWHRTIGGWPIAAIALHIVFITLGYAQTTSTGPLHEFVTLLFHYPDVMASAVGFSLLVLAGLSSHRIARSKMNYETWWIVHLYMYLGLGLAFAHQFRIGVVFLTHPGTRTLWIGAGVLVAIVAISSRVGRPVLFNLRHQLRVAAIAEETPGVYAMTIQGRHVEDLEVAGGQFFLWRFLARDLWWHAHPFSLSAMPRPPFLRVTVKAVGDASTKIARLPVGTRVLVEGPFGAFTRHKARRTRVTLIGAGVGVTPLLALLEDLDPGVEVSVIVRASRAEDLIHRDEIAAQVDARGGRYHEMIGPRQKVRLDSRSLRSLIPSIGQNDVFICGPVDFTNVVAAALNKAGVPAGHVHREVFSF